MGESYMYIFPEDPRVPKPSWTHLRSALLACGFIVEPKGDGVPGSALSLLWKRLIETRPEGKRRYPYSARIRAGLNGLLDTLKVVKILPLDFNLRCDDLSTADFITAMKQAKIVSAEFNCDPEESYLPGPRYFELSGDPDRRRRYPVLPEISFIDHGDRIYAHFGRESISAPPLIPGTDRVVGDWQKFLERWVGNPNEVWVDAATGARYGLLDLDWDHTLAVGNCMLEITSPQYLDGACTAALVSEIAGQQFTYSHSWI